MGALWGATPRPPEAGVAASEAVVEHAITVGCAVEIAGGNNAGIALTIGASYCLGGLGDAVGCNSDLHGDGAIIGSAVAVACNSAAIERLPRACRGVPR